MTGPAYLYRVFLMHGSRLLPAGGLLSPEPAKGLDMFRATPIHKFRCAADFAVSSGLIKTTDEFWDAYAHCEEHPECIVYSEPSRQEIAECSRNGGDISGALPYLPLVSLDPNGEEDPWIVTGEEVQS